MVEGFDHIVLTVADIERTLDFYGRTLGMRRQTAPNGQSSLHFGNQKINVHQVDRTFEPKAAAPTAGSGDFCLVTGSSIEELMTRLASEGVPVVLGPVTREGARGPMTSVYFRDPDGNILEVSRYS
jgi:catechol 2,3-dioxygenase-like lactoylglutathione lyase family enzyme